MMSMEVLRLIILSKLFVLHSSQLKASPKERISVPPQNPSVSTRCYKT